MQGKPILAVKVTKNAQDSRATARARPVLYVGAQHAREWITPEMTRRLMHHFLDSYGTDPAITKLRQHDRAVVRAGRQPRRLRLHVHRRATGCGARTCATTTATARSPPATASTSTATSPTSGATTTRAPRPTRPARPTAAPARTPSRRPRRSTGCSSGSASSSSINYHSAAELLLYGVGWQVSTPTPDDVIYEAMAGDDANPAVPGYDPDISAELYTTNGETDAHAQVQLRHARLHPGDVDLRDRLGRPTPTTSG